MRVTLVSIFLEFAMMARKSKCVHEGTAPCRFCSLKGNRCVLELPHRVKLGAHSTKPAKSYDSPRQTPATFNWHEEIDEPPRDEAPSSKVSKETLREAIERISYIFPEFFFIHKPSLLFSADGQNSLISNTILALCGFFAPIENDPFLGLSSPQVRDEVYSKYVLEKIFFLDGGLLLSTPKLEVAQSLLMMSIHEWGKGRNYSSWMVYGISTKILQALEFHNATETTKNAYEYEVLIRTFWSSFCVDRIISSGKNRSYTYLIKDVAHVPLPSPDADFMYMNPEDSHVAVISDITLANFSQIPLAERNQILIYYIKIFQIWGDISKWLFNGGRRTEQKDPWAEDSFVFQSFIALKEWKELLPSSFQWSVHAFRVNQTVKTHVLFATTHLVYNLCIIYLNREYIPFLPHSTPFPQGPYEPPLLNPPTDPEYWKIHASDLFAAAKNMALIASQLEALNDPVEGIQDVPFLSNCYFFCATVCLYACKFPWLNPENNPEEHEFFANELMSYLQKRIGISPLSANWLTVLDQLKELYGFVTHDLERARRLNIGRDYFLKLEDSVQAVNSDVPPPIRDVPGVGDYLRKEESNNKRPGSVPMMEDYSHRRAPESSDLFLIGSDQSAHEFLTLFLQTITTT
ncbi:unnamed protein product [Kuraishia capsulata CBS 1993]|uniref:Xylanolytic transcriptional activator regulatory domain-containing protein n=1 Tax=Kuraishia capsulata CBS 1993 TaxID=1382522 RepID=W6MTY1_9ASCO|nr:uncharacterized protein KUCA_T00001279001 [Kuraishia capsulata CBS 1993]CDK25310.1 unnamed protein product [Kuraishia capsulata CBS 1993]